MLKKVKGKKTKNKDGSISNVKQTFSLDEEDQNNMEYK